jgi:hypothetical protein
VYQSVSPLLLAITVLLFLTENIVSAEPQDLPLLPSGNHLGFIVGFDAYAPDVEVEERTAELLEDGMTVGRVQLDWVDLEPEAGVYNMDSLVDAMSPLAAQGLSVFVLLATVDSVDAAVTRPPDLQQTLYSDPVLLERFQLLLDRAIPVILQYSGFLLSVGNEPNSYLEENPSELEPMATFVFNTKQYVHLTAPDLGVSITLAAILEPLTAASDVVVFNLYGLDPNFYTAQDPVVFVQEIAAKQAIFGMDKPFIIQELGMPSGWEDKPSGMNTSPELAVSFCQVALQELKDNPHFRAAFWFTLVDWSAATTNLIIDELAAAGVPEFINVRIDEWLRTGGLVRMEQPGFSDGTTRPVWEAFRTGMRALYETIDLPSPTSAPLTDLPTFMPATLTTDQPSASKDSPGSTAYGLFGLSVFCQFTTGAIFGQLLGLFDYFI